MTFTLLGSIRVVFHESYSNIHRLHRHRYQSGFFHYITGWYCHFRAGDPVIIPSIDVNVD